MDRLKRAIFLDRDGVINQLLNVDPDPLHESNYVTTWEQFEFCERVFDAFRAIKHTQFDVIVVSNQSGIGQGYVEYDVVLDIFHRMREEICQESGFPSCRFDYYFCPHVPDLGCNCRKPAPGLFHVAAYELGIDLRRSWVIGDSYSDLTAGIYAGINPNMALKIINLQQQALEQAPTDKGDTFDVVFPVGAIRIKPKKYGSLMEAVMDLLLMDASVSAKLN